MLYVYIISIVVSLAIGLGSALYALKNMYSAFSGTKDLNSMFKGHVFAVAGVMVGAAIFVIGVILMIIELVNG